MIGVPDSRWREAVHAVVREADLEVDAAVLPGHCRNQLAGYKVPKSVAFVGELPRTATGKIYKETLRAQWQPPAAV